VDWRLSVSALEGVERVREPQSTPPWPGTSWPACWNSEGRPAEAPAANIDAILTPRPALPLRLPGQHRRPEPLPRAASETLDQANRLRRDGRADPAQQSGRATRWRALTCRHWPIGPRPPPRSSAACSLPSICLIDDTYPFMLPEERDAVCRHLRAFRAAGSKVTGFGITPRPKLPLAGAGRIARPALRRAPYSA